MFYNNTHSVICVTVKNDIEIRVNITLGFFRVPA